MTYPPEEIKGCLVAGFPLPSQAKDYTYPSSLVGKFAQQGWNLADVARQSYSRAALPRYIEGLYQRINNRFSSLELLLKEYPDWDFLTVHFMETDKIEHELWNYTEFQKQGRGIGEAASQLHHLPGVFEHIDRKLGQFLREHSRDRDVVIIMSDHGQAPCYKALFLNTWLAKRGFLRFRRHPLTQLRKLIFLSGLDVISTYRLVPRRVKGLVWKSIGAKYFSRRQSRLSLMSRVLSLGYRLVGFFLLSLEDIEWERSTAYALGGTGVGQVCLTALGEKRRTEVEARLKQGLSALRHPRTGEALISKIFLQNEIYSGPYLHEMPDLVFYIKDGEYNVYSHRFFLSRKYILSDDPLTEERSTHTPEGVFVAKGEGIREEPSAGAHIMDLFPTVLHLLEVPYPSDVDGRVRTEWFAEEGRFDRPVQTQKPVQADSSREGHAGWDDAEREEIKAQLQRMGYF